MALATETNMNYKTKSCVNFLIVQLLLHILMFLPASRAISWCALINGTRVISIGLKKDIFSKKLFILLVSCISVGSK